MSKPNAKVVAEAKKADVVKPKEKKVIDGTTARVVLVFKDIDFKSGTGGHGHRTGYLIADSKKVGVLAGATSLKRSYPNAMDGVKEPKTFSFEERSALVKALGSYDLLPPSCLIGAGSANTRPTHAKGSLVSTG